MTTGHFPPGRVLRAASYLALDPERGLPFDDLHDLAVVASWLQEVADDVDRDGLGLLAEAEG